MTTNRCSFAPSLSHNGVPSILQMRCLQENGVRFEYSSLTETNEFAWFFYSRMFVFLIYYCKIIESVSNAFFCLVIILKRSVLELWMWWLLLVIEGGVEFHTLIKGFCFSRWPIYDSQCVDFSSPERKAQSSFSPHLSSVCLFIFHMFSQEEPLNKFQPNLVQCLRGWREFKCLQMNQWPRPFPRGDNNEIAKIHRRLKIFFSRLTSPISTNRCIFST